MFWRRRRDEATQDGDPAVSEIDFEATEPDASEFELDLEPTPDSGEPSTGELRRPMV